MDLLRKEIIFILSKVELDKFFNELSNNHITLMLSKYVIPNKQFLNNFESAKDLLTTEFKLSLDKTFDITDQKNLYELLMKWIEVMK